ncbi:hypothetical protein WJX72_004845 [[Myrmecia] bisecta]|uniref:Rhodanese domain-containing protein n=1 Tax=[Myrmecia] bisecta TaxID=41462 RepID=A0AAW1QQD9_9CHLO
MSAAQLTASTAGLVASSGLRSSASGRSANAARPASAVKLQRPSRAQRPLTLCKAAASDTDAAMRAAEQRWESQVREGKVKNVTAGAAGDMMKDGWVLLDVRPETEYKKASVPGAIAIPIFVPEDEVSIGNLLKQFAVLSMGGWWLGGSHMKLNQRFLADVQAAIPKDAKVIVACQKGLRSLAAAEQLSRAGYSTLAWINGGFDTAARADLPVEGAADLRYGGIGGMSEVLGWTDVQREDKSGGFMGGSENIIKVFGVILALDVAWFLYDLVQSGALSQ